MGLTNAENKKLWKVQIACGMSKYDGDPDVAAVFDRADKMMYENKQSLKEI